MVQRIDTDDAHKLIGPGLQHCVELKPAVRVLSNVSARYAPGYS